MRGIIYAASPDGVIGRGGTIPWRYPGDLRRFKRVTLGSTIVMGRVTFDSIGKALPGRRNMVVTSAPLEVPGVESVRSVAQAVALAAEGDLWFIGGARVYEEAMRYADLIDVTFVPDRIVVAGSVLAPSVDETMFAPGPLLPHEDEPALSRRLYVRRTS